MDVLFPLIFIGLSLSIGIKLGFVYRDRFPKNSQMLLLAAVAQAVLVGYVAIAIPSLFLIFALLAGVGFALACLFDWLNPTRPAEKTK